MSYVVLLADNNPEFLQTYARVMAADDFDVKTAGSPEAARRLLENTAIDIAVLDVRLVNDNDDNDFSGIQLAADKAFRHIPKIMLTGFHTPPEHVREALGFRPDELPPAVAFVKKDEGPDKLLKVIRSSLEGWPKLRISTAKVSEQTKEDYQVVREQAKRNYNVARAVSIIGFVVIFVGICLAWYGKLTIGVVGTTAGLITEALSYLFFKRVDLANSRMDEYHRELLQSYWLELLVGTCQELPAGKRITNTEKVLQAAVRRWINPGGASKPPARPKKQGKA